MSGPERPGFVQGLRDIGASAVGVLQTRLALAGAELEEEFQRLGAVLVLALGLLIFGMVGLLCVSLLLVLVFSPEQRLVVLAVMSAVYIAAALWFAWRIRAALNERPPLLEATLAELAKDREALARGMKGSEAAAPGASEATGSGASAANFSGRAS